MNRALKYFLAMANTIFSALHVNMESYGWATYFGLLSIGAFIITGKEHEA